MSDKPIVVLKYGLTSTKCISEQQPHIKSCKTSYWTGAYIWHHSQHHASATIPKHLNAIERIYIYAEYINNNHINDDQTIFPNKIFDTLLKPHNPQKQNHPPPPLEQSDTPPPHAGTTSIFGKTQQFHRSCRTRGIQASHAIYENSERSVACSNLIWCF